MSIREIYRQLSPEMKGQFWTITTNCLLVLITFWMGITIQYMVYNMGTERQDQITRYQIVDKIYPMYQKAYKSSGVLIGKMSLCIHSENPQAEMNKLLTQSTDQIIETAEQSIPSMEKALYYVNKETADSIRKYNIQIKTMLKLVQWTSCEGQMSDKQLRDSIQLFMAGEETFFMSVADDFSNKIFETVQTGRKLPKGMKMVVAQKMAMPIVKNYEALRNEMFKYPQTDFVSRRILLYAITIFITSSIVMFLIWRIILQMAFKKKTKHNL